MTAPVRNGLPPQTYMTVPSSGETQATHAGVGQRVSEQHREHGREADDRDREDEHDPEQAAELRDVVAVTGMAGVAVLIFVVVMLVTHVDLLYPGWVSPPYYTPGW